MASTQTPAGHFEHLEHLEQVAKRIAEYAHGDPEVGSESSSYSTSNHGGQSKTKRARFNVDSVANLDIGEDFTK